MYLFIKNNVKAGAEHDKKNCTDFFSPPKIFRHFFNKQVVFI
jgi:hypothetical protein